MLNYTFRDLAFLNHDADCFLTCVELNSLYDDFALIKFKNWLSDNEYKKFENIGNQIRKSHFIFGRIATKISLQKKNILNILPQNIDIINVSSGAPKIIVDDVALNFQTSISHSKNIIAALIFNEKHQCGIDIEFMRDDKISALRKITKELDSINVIANLKNLTIAWSMKEALSKALQIGFNTDVDKFEIQSIKYLSPKFIKCKFKYYKNFNGFTLVTSNFILSIVTRSKN